MSNLPAFGTYAAAFELSLKDDDWSRLEQHFSHDAVYLPGDGTEAVGRDAVIQALQDSVNALERKCDSRDLVGEPKISESGDTITLKFTIKYSKKDLPDLILHGYETAQFSNGSILRMEDVFDDPSAMLDWVENL
jgi:ketosteroid isomerase-like protein